METQLTVTLVGLFAAYVIYKMRGMLKSIDPALLILIACAIGAVGYHYRGKLGFDAPAASAPVQTETSVSAVASKISGEDAVDLGNYFLAFAEQLEADHAGEYFKSIDDLRQVNSVAGSGGMKNRLQKPDGTPKYPGLSDAINAAMVQATGGRDTFISPDQRAKVVKLFRDLSAALK